MVVACVRQVWGGSLPKQKQTNSARQLAQKSNGCWGAVAVMSTTERFDRRSSFKVRCQVFRGENPCETHEASTWTSSRPRSHRQRLQKHVTHDIVEHPVRLQERRDVVLVAGVRDAITPGGSAATCAASRAWPARSGRLLNTPPERPLHGWSRGPSTWRRAAASQVLAADVRVLRQI